MKRVIKHYVQTLTYFETRKNSYSMIVKEIIVEMLIAIHMVLIIQARTKWIRFK